MKIINWKFQPTLLFLNNFLLHNRFESLCDSSDLNEHNINEIYSNLIEATESVAKEMLPLKPWEKANIVKYCPSVNSARENLKLLNWQRKKLDEAYLKAEADFIDGKINDISSLHINKKHHAAWKTIGELSGKKL